MVRRIAGAVLGAGLLLASSAQAFDHTQYGGDIFLEFLFARAFSGRGGYSYKASAVRNKSEKERGSETRSADLSVTETSFSLDGIDGGGLAGPLDGTLKTKNGKVYKVVRPARDSEEEDSLFDWLSDYTAGNGPHRVEPTVVKIKGKIKGGAGEDPVVAKMLLKYKGTVASGENFGQKASGKIKISGELAPNDE